MRRRGRYLPLIEHARSKGRRSVLATVYRSPEAEEVGARLALVEAPPATAGAAGPPHQREAGDNYAHSSFYWEYRLDIYLGGRVAYRKKRR